MTDPLAPDELEFLSDLKERFWLDFSTLCDKYIQEAADRFPSLAGPRYQEFISTAVMVLGESTSIYGRKTTP